MASVFVSSPAEVVVIDSRTRSGTITLPATNTIPNRVLNFKDQYGTFPNSTLTVSTQLGESFDDGATSKTFSNAFTYLSLYAVSSKWMVMGATQTVQQTISSLTVNQLNFGTGAGWVQFGPIQAPVVSSIQLNTNDAYVNNLYVGIQSTINDILFFGLQGNYNNSAIAEISTGAGTQELLFFRGSTTTDRFRFQTTGTFVVETGVSARLFSTNTLNTLSNVTPAFIINTSSNVGIQTASPGATLDVAGSIRGQTVSTLALTISSINGTIYTPGGGGGGGVTSLPSSLSTVQLLTSSLTASTATIGILSTFITTASTATINVGTISSVNTNAIAVGGSAGWLLTSPIQTIALSTNTIYSDTSYINTETALTAILSTVTTNNLTLGTGSGWIFTSPLQTAIVSSILMYANAPFFDTVNIGSVSTMNSLEFAGLFNNYNNTVLAEISTGGGSQELLVFRGSSASDRVRVQTTGTFVVETGVSARLFNSNTSQTLSNATPAFIINLNSNVGIQTASPGAPLDVAGVARAITLSSQQFFTSTFTAITANLSSATVNLLSSLIFTASTATVNQVIASTVTTNALSLNTNPSWILTSPIQTLAVSTNTIWADQGYINTGVLTTAILSTTTTNTITLGSGGTWIQTSPIQTSVVSTIFMYANTPFFDTVNIGSVSTVNSLEFAGLFNNYNNTVLAEISTGAGLQELLVFKGSSASDRVRVQTTGAFVVETGVSARLFNSNTTQTLSNATPAFLINTSSNVGIQTAAPGATLDVAGTGRFQTLSSLAFFASSIVAPSVFAAQYFTF